MRSSTALFLFYSAIIFSACSGSHTQNDAAAGVIFKNVNLITGDGSPVKQNVDVLVQGDTIAEIGNGINSPGATEVDFSGKTMMPSIISAHVHVGHLKGTATSAVNYTRENILGQLKKYARYGILNVQVMGTDRALLFQNGLYDSIQQGLLPGARMLSAGYGFNSPQANIDTLTPMGKLYRPASPQQVAAEMDSIAKLNIKLVKMWVDDFAGTVSKVDPAVYEAVINEAHQRNIRVAAHVYYLADARRLVNLGIDVLAHSIRDSVVDDAFLADMKAKNTVYIPTLTLDEYAYIYADDPEWINDDFFKKSLEPGVYEMITSEKYKNEVKNSPLYNRNRNGFKTAMMNLKKIFDAGIPVALGTDSGAMPVRTQGFSEHLEMQLLTEAGLTPMQAITVATKNAAEALKISDRYGTIEKSKVADLLILNGHPSADIKNTRKIEAVYKAGGRVSREGAKE